VDDKALGIIINNHGTTSTYCSSIKDMINIVKDEQKS
jgi:hypothetical protein